MNKELLLFLTLSLIPTLLFSGIDGSPTGARSFSLAGNSSILKDVWSVNNNPARLGYIKSWGGGISYENSFLLEELSTRSAIIAYPTQMGAFGLSYQQFGYSAFNENKIGLSYGQKLSENIALGIQINYLNTRIEEDYGNHSALSGNIGLYAQITDELSMATTIINPNRAKLASENDERYPTLINIGLGYELSKKVLLISEITKDIDYQANVKTAIEYRAIDQLYLRIGYATQPSLSSFGFGLNFNRFQIDFGSGFDSNLGFSSQISISFLASKNNDENN